MSDAATDSATTDLRWDFSAYHETPEHAALRGALRPPDNPVSIARTQLSRAVSDDGYVIDLGSIEEVERTPVIVNEAQTDYRYAGPDETPTGHVVKWTCTGSKREGTDAGDPVLTPDHLVFKVPENLRATGGSVRLRHNLGGVVTVHTFREDGTGIGHLFATPLDNHLLHVEFFAETAEFRVSLDD